MADEQHDSRQALARFVLEENTELIRFADRKAQMLLRLTISLFIVAFIGVPPAVIALKDFANDGGWVKLSLFLVVSILYVVCAGCLLSAITKIVDVIRPRLAKQPTNKLFFQSVARMQPDEFRRSILDMPPEQTLDELIDQAYQTSIIAQDKFKCLNSAINWLMGGGLIGIFFALILLVSYGWVAR